MAAAIILIPEMLSGPDRESPEATAERGSGPIKTYTIDLSQAPGSSPPPAIAEGGDNRAPPPEELVAPSATPTPAPSPAEQAPQEPPQVSPDPSPLVAAEAPAETTPAPQPRRDDPPPVVAEPPPRQIAAQPARAEAPPSRPVASAPTAPTSTVPTKSGWAVQLGSYSSEATAERLRNDWRAKGQDAFVMPVKSGGKTLYRVRIGPSRDRAGAEAALKAVKAAIPGAAIVAHP